MFAIEDVASKIQNDMIAYRKELGGEKKPPVSAQYTRAGIGAPLAPDSIAPTASTIHALSRRRYELDVDDG